jgi:hypothetical protein
MGIKSGIYKITNTANNKIYIGSSKNIIKRKNKHFLELSSNRHCNKKLQNSFNKYKRDKFTFEIIEECDIKILIEREQFYIDLLKPQFNIRLKAESNAGLKLSEEHKKIISEANKGKKLSKETIKKIIKTRKENGFKFTEESRKKMSESRKGNKNCLGRKYSEETIKKNSESNKGKQIGEKNGFFGKKHSEETKRKMREKWILRKQKK